MRRRCSSTAPRSSARRRRATCSPRTACSSTPSTPTFARCARRSAPTSARRADPIAAFRADGYAERVAEARADGTAAAWL